MTKCWYNTNINVDNALNKSFKVGAMISDCVVNNKQGNVWVYRFNECNDIFSQEWLAYMEEINLPVSMVKVFYANNVNDGLTHIDLLDIDRGQHNIAINWTLAPSDGDMVWYATPDSDGEDLIIPDLNIKYNRWNENYDFGMPIDRCNIGSAPTLVRTDIPHRVLAITDVRFAISVRCFPTKQLTQEPLWESIVAHCSDIIQPRA